MPTCPSLRGGTRPSARRFVAFAPLRCRAELGLYHLVPLGGPWFYDGFMPCSKCVSACPFSNWGLCCCYILKPSKELCVLRGGTEASCGSGHRGRLPYRLHVRLSLPKKPSLCPPSPPGRCPQATCGLCSLFANRDLLAPCGRPRLREGR